MQKQQSNETNIRLLLLLILMAYLFSVGVRMYWPMHFAETASMYYDNVLMINTNDGYFFASGAKDIINGVVPDNAQRMFALNFGLTDVTAFITKVTPFSLETVILYLPAIISSLVVIPIILTARLMGHTLLGFFAALIGSIAWSYYNRTMVGYYDSDMFAIFLQFTTRYSSIGIIDIGVSVFLSTGIIDHLRNVYNVGTLFDTGI
jgi:dolichyl-diphosphooligosaccharide--protein glycosyltransferase/undecaprenyl-diphosphooligosaccharide--protein glycosyltransferase